MAPPLVSVVMPAWNTAAYVGEAIGSILAQSMGDFELLVVDDGSTDSTLEIARSFDDRRLRVLQNPVNLGIATARNLALAVAQGQYIAMMDSDDVALPQRLAEQIDFLAANPDIDICGTDAEIFSPRETQFTNVPAADAGIKAMLVSARSYLVNPTTIVRRALIDRHAMRFRSDLTVTSDYAFWVACVRNGARFANIKQRLLRYRWHGRNISRPSAGLQAGIEVTQTALLGLLHPGLRGREVDALAALFSEAPLDFEQLCAGVAAARLAIEEPQSRFGEDRKLVARLIQRRIVLAQRSVRKMFATPAAMPA